MEFMLAAVQKGDLHIGDGPAHAALVQCQGKGLGHLILVVGLDGPDRDLGGKLDAAAPFARLDAEAQDRPAGLRGQIGNIPFRGLGDGLPVEIPISLIKRTLSFWNGVEFSDFLKI